MATTLNPKSIGTCYEALARRYLEHKGLVFVAANVILRCGEIDLIMRDKETLVFVEVRFRRNTRFGGAGASITHIKKQRLLQTAAVWLAQQGGSFDTKSCRFDVFAITGDKSEWLTNAFSLY